MNWKNITFDWNHVRAFLASAETGSFSAAAAALNLTQPTLGRQVAALEAELGLALFERQGRSIALTAEGRTLLSHVEAMGEAAARLSMAASGQRDQIDGTVSITASDLLSTHMLPKIIADIRAQAPALEVEVVAINTIANIQKREADIAIRHTRPEQPNLIGKLLRESSARFYASPAYLERYGAPSSSKTMAGHVLIGFDDRVRFIERLQGIGLAIDASQLKLISANGSVAWAMACQGLGLCMMDDQIAKLYPDMVAVLPEESEVAYPTWLITHEELKNSRRIRLVFDRIAEGLS